MKMIDMNAFPAYELVRQEEIPDIKSNGYQLRHKKSGARILLLENEDENKVFNIAFRTTPTDSTGVAHIMEHSVLCGSEKYPSKDPFVELAKGSMNTFLNAMTYPDKTMYPVASCNDVDFVNLIHVYLDAVFFPNIYRKEEIFRQEGWSYQLENPEDPITINGVVYNEMKGAFSSPDDVLEREILNALFPDNTYHFESGGDPQNIPDLTYEAFLDFHRRFYHPSNSYLYLYGKMDFAAQLDWIDREYLSRFEVHPVDSSINLQKPFDQMLVLEKPYSISSEESLEDNTYLSYSAVIGRSTDTVLATAFSILEYVLLESPGAPLKEALLEAGIGTDIQGSYDSGTMQPVFSVIAKGANADDRERFLDVVRSALEKICSEGLEERSLQAAINLMEFRFREGDYGNYPKGLLYGINLFDTWLYDEDMPFAALRSLEEFAFLKKQIGTDYFTDLIRTWLLDNSHSTLIVLLPERGLTAKTEKELADQLAKMKAEMTPEEIEEMIRKTQALRAFQETPSTKEELEAIPLLTREDMKKTSQPLKNQAAAVDGGILMHHEYETNGIAYINFLLDASKVPAEDLPYLGILRGVLGYVDTEHYSYASLADEIGCRTGGIAAGISVYPMGDGRQEIKAGFGFQIRTLTDELPFCFDMIQEILLTSDLAGEKRLKDLIGKMKSRVGTSLQEAGNATAATRSMSHFSGFAWFNDQIGGIAFYRKLQEIAGDFEGRKALLKEKLASVLCALFGGGASVLSYTGSREQLGEITRLYEDLNRKLGICGTAADLQTASDKAAAEDLQATSDKAAAEDLQATSDKAAAEDLQAAPDKAAAEDLQTASEKTDKLLAFYPVPELEKCSEGFKTAAKIQYVARSGNYRKEGYTYTGAMRVLRTIMSYEYLWNQVRVVGGAYGCSGSFSRSGDVVFASYRDPHLKRTSEVYEGIPAWLESFSVDERDMTKYVIGTMSDMDIPLSPRAMGSRSFSSYIENITEEEIQRSRDEVLGVTVEDIRALAAPLRAALSQGHLCVLGGEDKIREAEEMFDRTEMLQ